MTYRFKIGDQRLLVAAKHLESRRALDRFDFTTVCAVITPDVATPKHPCGTIGCVMGELPAIWPDVFTYTQRDYRMADYRAVSGEPRRAIAELPSIGAVRSLARIDVFPDLCVARMTTDIDGDTRPDPVPVREVIEEWFQLTDDEAEVLFFPIDSEIDGEEPLTACGGAIHQLEGTATALEVAQNFRHFVTARRKAEGAI